MVQYSDFNRAMKTRDHLNNGANSKSYMGRVNFLITVFFALLVVFCGCEKEDDKSIDTKLVGKWEIQSMTFSGKTYDLTDPNNPLGVSSGGYEFTTSKMKTFMNGSLLNEGNVYTKGSKIYNTNAKGGINWQVSGNTLTINYIDADSGITFIEVYQKVSEFSWE